MFYYHRTVIESRDIMEYCSNTYSGLLNDFIHIMDKHRNDVDQIRETMKEDFRLMNDCNIKNCIMV